MNREGVQPAFGLRAAITLLVLIAIAPVFAVVVQASLSEQQARLERARSDLRSVADLAAAHQERLVDGARQVLAAIAYSPAVHGDDVRACAEYMQRLLAQYPGAYGSFGVIDPQGALTCRSQPPPANVNSRDRLFFREAVRTGHFAVGEYTLSRASGRPVLTFGLPVIREGGGLRGVAYLAVDLQHAGAELRRLALTPEVTLFVADRNGIVIAASGAHPIAAGEHLPQPFLRTVLAAHEGLQDTAHVTGGQDWYYATRPAGRESEGRLFVVATASAAEVVAPATARLRMQLAVLALIALAAALAAWIFGDRVLTRPMGRLLGRVDALAREETLEAPSGRRALRELTELDSRFHSMARALAQRSVQRDGALAEMAGQNRLLESILGSMAEGVIVLDSRGRLLHMNAAARAILPGIEAMGREAVPLGVEPAAWGLTDLDGRPLRPQDRPASRVLRGEDIESFRLRARGLLSGGPDKVIRGSARMLFNPEGRQYGAVIVFTDATAEHDAAQALFDSERRYRELFESNPHPMWVFDTETLRFLEVNDAAVAHYGYSRAEFLSMTLDDIRPADDVPALHESLRRLEANMQPPRVWRHRLKDGTLIQVEISSHLLEFQGRPARMVLANDVTQRELAQHMLEQRVAERTRELAISNGELESFAYSVSHDLRAPLQVIDGFGRALLARHAGQLDEQARHYLHRIRENTRQMGALIDDLLSLARVTRAEIRREPVDLAPRARGVVERLRQRDPERQVEVHVHEPILVEGDPGLLDVVLENLLGNAWKFTGRTAAARIEVGARREHGTQVVYVADNGAGFDMAYADKLFKAFQRLHAATDFHGTGIGLATVHRIVGRHGGAVWATSEPGRGAVFHFTLEGGPPP